MSIATIRDEHNDKIRKLRGEVIEAEREALIKLKNLRKLYDGQRDAIIAKADGVRDELREAIREREQAVAVERRESESREAEKVAAPPKPKVRRGRGRPPAAPVPPKPPKKKVHIITDSEIEPPPFTREVTEAEAQALNESEKYLRDKGISG